MYVPRSDTHAEYSEIFCSRVNALPTDEKVPNSRMSELIFFRTRMNMGRLFYSLSVTEPALRSLAI